MDMDLEFPSDEWWHRNFANIISVCNIGVALCSIAHSLAGRSEEAAWTLLLTTLLDELDGAVARTLKTVSALGARMDDVADWMSFVPGLVAMVASDSAASFDNGWPVVLLAFWLLLVFYFRHMCASVKCDGYYNGLPTNYMAGLAAPVLLLTGSTRCYALALLAASVLGLPGGWRWYAHPKLLESQSWKKVLFVVLLTLVGVRTGAILVFAFFSSYAIVPEVYSLTPRKTQGLSPRAVVAG